MLRRTAAYTTARNLALQLRHPAVVRLLASTLSQSGLQQRLDELEARRVQLEQDLATGQTNTCPPNLAQVYRRQVERLQDALNEPEIRDEALQILRGLVERVSIGPAQNGLEVEIVGEIAKMVELGIGNKAKRGPLDEMMTRSVKVVAGVGFEPTTFRL